MSLADTLQSFAAEATVPPDARSQQRASPNSRHAEPKPGSDQLVSSAMHGGASAAPADVLCREATWNFGTVDVTKTRHVSHTFAVENAANASVKVDDVDASCGCIVPSDYPRDIPPSSTADFGVTVDLAGPPRRFQKVMTIHLATVPPSKLVLNIHGEVEASPAFYSTPATVDFGTVGDSEIRSRVVKIARFDGSAVNFVRGVPHSEAVSLVRAVKTDETVSIVELTISVDGSLLRSGDFTTTLDAQTTHPTYTGFSIPIKARLAGADDGLLAALFARDLRAGTPQDMPLTKEGVSASVEDVSYEGDAPIAVELVPGNPAAPNASPVVRISRTDEGPSRAKQRVVSGHLLVTLAGRTSPVRMRIFVQLTD